MNARARKIEADAFPIPELALEQHIAVLGKTGCSGVSGRARHVRVVLFHVTVMAEQIALCGLSLKGRNRLTHELANAEFKHLAAPVVKA
jgi:hypothetical protein